MQVLEVEADPEAGLEVPLEEVRPAQLAATFVAARPPCRTSSDPVGFDAGLRAEDEGLGDRLDDDGDDDLVADLDDLAGAGRPDVDDRLAQRPRGSERRARRPPRFRRP